MSFQIPAFLKFNDFTLEWQLLHLLVGLDRVKLKIVQKLRFLTQLRLEFLSQYGIGNANDNVRLIQARVTLKMTLIFTLITALTLKSSPSKFGIPRKVPGMISRIKFLLKLIYSRDSSACRSTSLMVCKRIKDWWTFSPPSSHMEPVFPTLTIQK